ncbi:UDP-glucuronosyltransferase 2C1-like isoform X2 [Diadema antillarum]|uniref:UDP-glucuronosyltransferase 2C1-like isoform X2 n=1 Tax=Diadema antillarum TaxID=105358 RepID=UPI003A86D7D4
MEKIISQAFKQTLNLELITNFSEIYSPFIEDCRATLGDRDLMDRLSRAKFDVTVLDATWLCSILLSEYLNTTNILLNPMASQYYIANLLSGAPFLPAVIPGGILGLPQRMSFLQRVTNVVWFTVLKQLFHLYGTLINPLIDEFGILQDKSVSDYMANFSLILMSMDPVMDLIVPFPPSVIEVGGLLTKPAQQLNKELDDFMNSAGDEGVIVFSLGTYVKAMPQRYNDLFASVFARLPQKVVWQLPDGTPTKLADNIKTMEWLPQNDLLGHPQTRLFMYQGGNNGLYEALYHGVPIVVLPVFSDQLSVAARVTEKGMGVSLSIHSITAENLEAAINTVTQNNTYMKTAKRLSAIYRDRPQSPADRAAFWVEHVMKYGGKDLRSPVKDLNFVQLYLIDVYAFLFTCFLLFVVIFYYTCKLTCRCCKLTCRRMISSKPKQD